MCLHCVYLSTHLPINSVTDSFTHFLFTCLFNVIIFVLLQVTVNWFQMQQAQTVSLPAHFQALTDGAKLYEPGECYAEFVRNLPKNLPKERLHSDSISSDNTRYQTLRMHT